jgi:inorganic pyrophosphatase/exopolyphosphatase
MVAYEFLYYCPDCKEFFEVRKNSGNIDSHKQPRICPFCLSSRVKLSQQTQSEYPLNQKYIEVFTREGTPAINVYGENQVKKIIDHIDMADCDCAPDNLYRINPDGSFTELKMHGAWHLDESPLYIKVTDPNTGITEFDGWGTNH